MKIHELAEKTGLTAPTIRFYEKEGLLDSRHVLRVENNYRDYSEKTIEHLKLIKKFQSVGFSLAELKDIIQEHDSKSLTNLKVVELLTQKIIEIERKQDEFKLILGTLKIMLENKIAMVKNPENGISLFEVR
jgi:MerR family transcriptional regulator, copper efflux regulator